MNILLACSSCGFYLRNVIYMLHVIHWSWFSILSLVFFQYPTVNKIMELYESDHRQKYRKKNNYFLQTSKIKYYKQSAEKKGAQPSTWGVSKACQSPQKGQKRNLDCARLNYQQNLVQKYKFLQNHQSMHATSNKEVFHGQF